MVIIKFLGYLVKVGYIGLPLDQQSQGVYERNYIIEHIDSYYMVLDHETSDGTWWRFTLQNMDYDGGGNVDIGGGSWTP